MDELDLCKRWNVQPLCGAACPQGWLHVVDNLMEELALVRGWHPKYVAQIKEKFGALREYVDYPEDAPEAYARAVDAIISAAEKLSLETCEDCGWRGHEAQVSTGRTKGRYSIRTLCHKHRELDYCPECRQVLGYHKMDCSKRKAQL